MPEQDIAFRCFDRLTLYPPEPDRYSLVQHLRQRLQIAEFIFNNETFRQITCRI
jgi:hypothetical protein